MTILVAIPVLNRPHRAQPVADSLRRSLTEHTPARILFVCSPDDTDELQAVQNTNADHITVPWQPGPGDYARKINHAATLLQPHEQWLFTGADDLHFHPGWADHALHCHHRHGSRVIGTQDLGNPAVRRGQHSTHTLVHRTYIDEHGTIDQPGLVYHDGYHHNWCDAELVDTAKARREFLHCPRAVVEHLHPHWRKAEMDSTYQAGLAEFQQDRRLFNRRRRRWATGRSYRRSLL